MSVEIETEAGGRVTLEHKLVLVQEVQNGLCRTDPWEASRIDDGLTQVIRITTKGTKALAGAGLDIGSFDSPEANKIIENLFARYVCKSE